MLQAKSGDGTFITLAALPKEEIERHRKKQPFYCPLCREKVIVKAGPKTIPHFAHRSAVHCPSAEGGEGAYHEKGKLLLYLWLKHQRLNAELEVYIPEIRQRPDILLMINEKKIAIEFQCAKVQTGQIKQRNEGYQRLGITPIWILGASRFKRQSASHFRLDTFTRQFMHQFSLETPRTLFYFCPHTHQFAIIQDIYFTRMGQALGTCSFRKLKQLRFPDIFLRDTISDWELYQLWGAEKRKFRLQRHTGMYGDSRTWNQWLYLKRTHPEQLPSIIHLPVPAQYRMKTPPWNWQSRFILDMLAPLPLNGQFTLNKGQSILRGHVYPEADFPLISHHGYPLYQYLQLLERLWIVKQQSANIFIKTAEVTFHKNIETALVGDQSIIRQLQQSSALNKL